MIHAYNEYFVSTLQEKLGCMFELAVLNEGISIDEFTNKFLASPISKAFETANSIYIEGKSANELLALVLNTKPKEYKQSSFAKQEEQNVWDTFVPVFWLRVGELLAFEWNDIDIQKGIMTISMSCHDGRDKTGKYTRIIDTRECKLKCVS